MGPTASTTPPPWVARGTNRPRREGTTTDAAADAPSLARCHGEPPHGRGEAPPPHAAACNPTWGLQPPSKVCTPSLRLVAPSPAPYSLRRGLHPRPPPPPQALHPVSWGLHHHPPTPPGPRSPRTLPARPGPHGEGPRPPLPPARPYDPRYRGKLRQRPCVPGHGGEWEMGERGGGHRGGGGAAPHLFIPATCGVSLRRDREGGGWWRRRRL